MHAIAFIGHVRGSIEDYVDDCYSVEKFRATYEHIIPGLVDKSQWPKGDHGFFLEPPILKSVAGRRRKNRYKGSEERSKGAHKCPICKRYGHHWHSCRDGDPEQKAAMLLESYLLFLYLLHVFTFPEFMFSDFITLFCFKGATKEEEKEEECHTAP